MAYPKLTDRGGAIATAQMIASGALSPLEAVDHAIGRIERLDAHVNAIAVCDFDRARDTARALERAGAGAAADQPLFGVPMTVKESFDVAGLSTCWGHPQFAGQIADADAEVVRRLKAAGAIIVGKTNVPPDLADWQSHNPVYGRTNNPHDHARSPGGSSGGSAAAVASGMVACEFGTDIGGSIRVPAHFCGIWGHKPSWGAVSRKGHVHPAMAQRGAHEGVLSVAGPLARNPADLDLLLQLTADAPLRRRSPALDASRLLLLIDHPGCPVDGAVRSPVEAAVEALAEAGATIVLACDRLPDLAAQHRDYMRMLNITMARGAPGRDGRQASAADWFDLLDSQARCEAAWAALFDEVDFVLAPPAPLLAFAHREGRFFDGTMTIDGAERPAGDALAWAGLASFPNLPSTVLPIGESDGLPCGMQIIGPRGSDLDCIATAGAIGEVLHG